MQVAHELSGIVTLSTHLTNFTTGGPHHNVSNRGAVKDILPGGRKMKN